MVEKNRVIEYRSRALLQLQKNNPEVIRVLFNK